MAPAHEPIHYGSSNRAARIKSTQPVRLPWGGVDSTLSQWRNSSQCSIVSVNVQDFYVVAQGAGANETVCGGAHRESRAPCGAIETDGFLKNL